MKKIIFFLVFSISILLWPMSVLAVDFSIENTQINAYLQENGDVKVTEQHQYQFDGDFNGITRTLHQKENTPIENVQAHENNQALKVEQDNNLYKVYRSGSDESITIDLTYTIKNGVDRYLDVAQFYWSFFDSTNESTYANMDIYIHPPQSTEEVIAFGYDEAQNTLHSEVDGIAHFALGKVQSGENGNIQVAYDASLFPSANIIAEENKRDAIIAEQTALKEKLIAFENRQDLFSKIAPFVIGLFTVCLVTVFIIAWRKKRMTLWEVDRNTLQTSFLPKEEMSLPATILYMRQTAGNGPLISAALMDLVRKGLVKRETENEFVVVHQNTDHEHESILIDWLFYKVGNKGKFSTSDLETYTKKKLNQSYYHKYLSEWYQAIKTEIKQNQLMEKKLAMRLTTGIIGMLLIPTAILFLVYELYWWMTLSFFLSFSFFGFALFYQPRTEKGVRIKQEWQQFSTRYANIEEKQWNEWMSDEQMKAFIYAIGTGNKQMQTKNEAFLKNMSAQPTTDLGVSSNDMVMLMILSGTLTNHFNEADRTVSAATMDGSSSGTGGGTGVGGSGGGSGAF
ncbi:DUF2207 domain-containing protein [Aquibacillus koreensis]|uniref:DUF2207 domain-containing protein n=1 Tax=Aquibacillus koreensis TaxID=279446 RepID=A0A9X3WL61_9BACI|nr:DUF2207 domain-containing protein [Aquibacillus koreensis]MCT2536513.1 DUF2207 domain-containing protein [Aquibacillus koreensis]MDC3419399.1 DUF2207 domain-containing protein [Aquibacillus koreensis]